MSDARKAEGPVELRLADGLTAILVPGPEDGAACALVVRVDDSVEDKRKGLAHFTEHLLSRHLRELSFPASVGVTPPQTDWDAVTTMDGIRFTWANLEAEHGVPVAAGYVRGVREFPSAITVSAFEAEREAVLAELRWLGEREEEDPEAVLRRMTLEVAYPGSALGVGEPAGIIEEVDKVQREEIEGYVSRLLSPANCSIVLVIGGAESLREEALESLGEL